LNAEFLTRSLYNGLQKSAQKKPSLIGERNISIYKNGIYLQAKTFDIFLDWQIFNYFSETDNLFILYFRGKEFKLIPKRCFENLQEIEQFREFLQNKAKNLDDNFVSREKIAEQDTIAKLEYQLEAKDYLEAKQAANFSGKWVVLYYPIILLIFFYSGFYSLCKGIYRTDLLGSHESSGDAIFSGCLGLGVGFYWLLTQYPKIDIFQRRKIAKKWDNNPEMQANIKLIVTENEIILMSDYLVESIALQEYLKYIENQELFLLYYSEQDYQIIPKKAFKEEEINQFREKIQSKNKIVKMSF